jgi:osmotically-inducible protein OsmY
VPEDEALRAAVHRALIEEQEVNLLEVDAEVEKGIVYLTGETRDRERKVHAGEIARRVPGVKDVVNKIGIEP